MYKKNSPKYEHIEGPVYTYLVHFDLKKKSSNYDYKLSSWVCLTDTRPVKHSFCLKQTFKIKKLTATCINLLKWLHMNLNNKKLKALNIILIESLKLLVYKQGRMLPEVVLSFNTPWLATSRNNGIDLLYICRCLFVSLIYCTSHWCTYIFVLV